MFLFCRVVEAANVPIGDLDFLWARPVVFPLKDCFCFYLDVFTEASYSLKRLTSSVYIAWASTFRPVVHVVVKLVIISFSGEFGSCRHASTIVSLRG